MPPRKNVPAYQYVWPSDDLSHEDNVKIHTAWKKTLLAPPRLRELEAFVGNAMHGTATYIDTMSGSYNVVLKFQVVQPDTAEQHVALRLQMQGFSPPTVAFEVLENEVACMQYFAEHGIAKVPAVYAWGTISGSPYILMEFVAGEQLDPLLLRWKKSEDPQDTERLHTAYTDIATILLAMYSHRFDKIGALRPPSDDGGDWAVTERPLTHAMRDLLINVPGTTTEGWPDGPLSTAADYKALFLQLHRANHDNLRSINIPRYFTKVDGEPTFLLHKGESIDMDLAKAKAAGRIVAHHGFAHPDCAPYLSASDTGPFRLFNRDIHARNMLADPETGHIVAVIDLESTNVLPAAFAEDPPLFLLSYNLFKNIVFQQLEKWVKVYEPFLETFLGIMERLEAQEAQKPREEGQAPLSARMRASWKSRKWLLHFAMHEMEASDNIFWQHLHGKFESLLDAEQAALEPEIEAYQEWTVKQIADYERERISREERASHGSLESSSKDALQNI